MAKHVNWLIFQRTRRLLAVLFSYLLLAPLFFVPVSASSVTTQLQVIRVGCFPYERQLVMDSDGNYSGYAFDYLQEIARYTGWRYEFVDVSWGESLQMLQNGEIDLMGAMIKTPTREQLYDFSEQAMMSSYGVLATTLDNETLPYEDFAAFNALRVGVIDGSLQAEYFREYSKQNNCVPRILTYSTDSELYRALDAKTIDAAVFTSLLQSPELRVVAKFGGSESFFATTKGNTAMLDALNNAMEQIHFNNPYFNSDLSKKFFGVQADMPLSFTREELDYIKASGPIRCLYNASLPPISYYSDKTNAAQGIVVDLCALLKEKTGLTFEMIPSDNPTGELLNNGTAELLLTQFHDFGWAQANGAVLTDPYLDGQLIMVTNDSLPDNPVFALHDEHFSVAQRERITESAGSFVYYDTVADCLDAVLSGKADATLINSNVMSYMGGDLKYARLQVSPVYGDPYNFCMAVSGQSNPVLVTILGKALENVTDSQMNSIVSANLAVARSSSILSFVYARPLESMLLVSGVLLLLAFILLLFLRSRAKNTRDMRDMLYTDALTGHPNYKSLTEDAIALLGDHPERYALLYMDMHRFKAVNDTFGYDAGDRVLIAMSHLLHNFIQSDERFARVYADKFVILLRFVSYDALNARLRALSTQLDRLSTGEFQTANFLFSGGVYRFPEDSHDLGTAFDRATYAKDTVREHFVNTFIFYDDVMRNQVLVEKSLEGSMLPALERGEFIPFYQPKVNVVTEETVGVEALVRWKQSGKNFRPPDEFLPFYEKNGFIVRIDFAVFEAVCRDLRRWLDGGHKAVPVSVNFSRRHMQNKQFVQKLTDITDQYRIPHNLLEIEITETIALESMDVAVAFAQSLKDCGFSISIDDYGTGYSSISFLQDLPLDVLKLDKAFIESAMRTPKARDLMSHLVQAVKNNGIRVMCEGIETVEQRDFIMKHNCSFAQGYLYAKPMPREDFEAYLLLHGTAPLDYPDVLPIADFANQAWTGANSFLNRVMPGWILGCYASEGYPIFYISPELIAKLGYSEPEFLHITGGCYERCVHPDDLEATLEKVQQHQTTEAEFTLQYRLVKKDGGSLWLHDVGKRIQTDNGQAALLRVCTDITDMVTAQQEKQALMEAIPGGICELIFTTEGPVIQNALERFYEAIGHTAPEMEALGNRLFSIVHEDDLQNAIYAIYRACSLESKNCECIFRVRYPDGNLHWVSLRCTLRRVEAERRATAVAFNIDAEVLARQDTDVIHDKLALALTLTDHAVFEYDLETHSIYRQDGLFLHLPAQTRLDGVPESLIEDELVHPSDADALREAFRKIFEGTPHASCKVWLRSVRKSPDAPFQRMHLMLSTVYAEDGTPAKAVGLLEECGEECETEAALERTASADG